MTNDAFFSLAKLSFAPETVVNLAFVVSDLRRTLDSVSTTQPGTLWAQDDLVSIKFGALHIILFLDDDAADDGGPHLTLALGADTGQGEGLEDADLVQAATPDRLRAILRWLVQPLHDRLSPRSIVWAEVFKLLTPEAVENASWAIKPVQGSAHAGALPTDWQMPVSDAVVAACLDRMPAPKAAERPDLSKKRGLFWMADSIFARNVQKPVVRPFQPITVS